MGFLRPKVVRERRWPGARTCGEWRLRRPRAKEEAPGVEERRHRAKGKLRPRLRAQAPKRAPKASRKRAEQGDRVASVYP